MIQDHRQRLHATEAFTARAYGWVTDQVDGITTSVKRESTIRNIPEISGAIDAKSGWIRPRFCIPARNCRRGPFVILFAFPDEYQWYHLSSSQGSVFQADMTETSRIFVRGLPPSLSTEEFRQHFSKQAAITDAKFIPHRRIGYVGYQTTEDATKAIRYHNKTFIRMSRILVEPARSVCTTGLRPISTGLIWKVSSRSRIRMLSDQAELRSIQLRRQKIPVSPLHLRVT